MWHVLAIKNALLSTAILYALVIYPYSVHLDWSHFSETDTIYPQLLPQVREYFVQVRDANLHINEVGNPKGEKLMILLHGFLGTGLVEWKYQLLHYAKSTEYRVIAPDLRGFNTSSKSEDVYISNWGQSTYDIADLIGLLGYNNATLIGHDGGTLVSYLIALKYPSLVDKHVVLNGFHPYTYHEKVDLEQLKKSYYVLLFQLPLIHYKIRSENFSWFLSTFMESNPKAFSVEDVQRLQDAWSQPLAVESMINHYRKLFRRSADDKLPPSPFLQAPSLLIFGQRDPFLKVEFGMDAIKYCTHPLSKAILVPEASHFIQQDIPEKLNQLIDEFLQIK